MPKKSLHITVSGRVQGVHFRGTMRNYAQALGLTGFSESLPDGSVKIVAEGEENILVSFLKLAQYGSLLSKVAGLEYKWEEFSKKYDDFSILHHGGVFEDELISLTNLGKDLLFPKDTVLPNHIAIIPDGNRRWARERGLHTLEGHKAGFNRFKELSKVARDAGIKTVTAWCFSTENWDRDESEVKYLFALFDNVVGRLAKEAKENEIRFRHLGRKDRIPAKLAGKLAQLEKSTANYSKYFFNLALDYGGRDEILRVVKKLINDKVEASSVNDKLFSKSLDTGGLSDPDLIIRTSGEQRLSGLLPWQGTYAELYFAPVHFPDFDATQLKLALLEYSQRHRRFGK